MKKTKVVVCVVVALILVMSATTAFAAGSPIASNATVTGAPDGVTFTVDNVYSPSYAAIVNKELGVKSNQYIAALLWITPSKAIADGSYKVNIPLSGLSGAKSAQIYHYVSGSGWVAIPTTLSSGSVSGTTPNFSLFAVVVTKSTGGSTTTTGTSPKTDDGSPLGIILLTIAAAAVCGGLFAGKRAKAVK